MTVYSQESKAPRSSSSSVSFQVIVSDDETSSKIEVFAVSSSSSYSSSIPSVGPLIHPPDTVFLRPQPSVVPYAQLCFDKELQTLSTMLVGTKMEANHGMPQLAFSHEDSSNDDSSGWSTGYSSDESDIHEDYHHRSHGIVWISREWWMRGEPHDDAGSNDHRALLPELHLARSSSSEESASSMLSLASCGKLFCHSRKSENRVYRDHAVKEHTERNTSKSNNRFYGYQLLKN